MTRIRVAAAALNQTPLDWSGNEQNILAAIDRRGPKARRCFVCRKCALPAMVAKTPFTARGFRRRPADARGNLARHAGHGGESGAAAAASQRLFNWPLLGGRRANRGVRGQAVSLRRRSALRAAVVQALAAADVRDMSRSPVENIRSAIWCSIAAEIKIGFEICEDAWVAGRPGGEMSPHAVDMILNPSASHFAFGKFEVRKRLVLEGSRAFHVSYVYANLLGNEAGRIIYDGGALIASAGRCWPPGRDSRSPPGTSTSAVVDVTATRMSTARLASFQPDLGRDNPRKSLDRSMAGSGTRVPCTQAAAWETGPQVKEEEFTRAMALGLFDYLRKSRSQGFVVSLSGGADSSAVACLVALMVEMAHAELGDEAFWRASRHIAGLAEAKNPARSRASPVALRLPSHRQQQRKPRDAAAALGEALGAEISCLDDRSTGGGLRFRHRTGTWGASSLGRATTWPCKTSRPGFAAQRVAVGQREERPAAFDQQPQRSGRGLCHDGRRHLRRPQPDRRHRQGVSAPLAPLARDQRPAGRARRSRPWQL